MMDQPANRSQILTKYHLGKEKAALGFGPDRI